ncbi:MAG: sulfotransferase [Gammaproteobacteria bacterium]|nr:sulfotransferase [Gammaproteobacteria bacterium]
MNVTTRGSELANDAKPELARVKSLIQKGHFAEAERLTREISAMPVSPTARRDAFYMLAVSQRYREKHEDALRTLDALHELAPTYARGHQERGHTNLTLNRLDDATSAYENAVRLNPALLASWKALVNLYDLKGDKEAARAAYAEAEELAKLPPELLAVRSLLYEDEIYRAERLCREFLTGHKHHIEGMRLLAEIGVRLEVLDDAEFLLESCAEFAPDYVRARVDYVNVLLRRQKFERAYQQAKLLLDSEPENLGHKSLLASAASGLGESAEAIRLYNEVLAKSPQQNKVLVMRGHAQKAAGEFDEAIASYQQAYTLDPYYGDAFWSLANTKVYQFTDEEIEHMRRYQAESKTSTDDRVHMSFALGKAYEDRRDFDESFRFYSQGNGLKYESVRHKAARLAARVDSQIEVCTADLFERQGGHGCDAPDPIFIVGLPRAGSTLLEQILASHSMVDGTMELPNILSLANRLRGRDNRATGDGPNYPRILRDLDPEYFARFGEQFIEDTRVYRADAPRFIDKMPNNFFHVGLIRLILPNAKIIDARRHPMACCFSGFKQLFGDGQEFSYGLTEIGNYYRKYVELMDHWDRVLPGFVHRVNHEDVVADLEREVRRMLEFCGLPFEEKCLSFYSTERSVRTPSSEQVRQPIYKSGLDQWRNYERHLEPLRDALGEEILGRYPVG